MSLSSLVSFKSRFVTYLLNFPRIWAVTCCKLLVTTFGNQNLNGCKGRYHYNVMGNVTTVSRMSVLNLCDNNNVNSMLLFVLTHILLFFEQDVR